VSLTYDGRGNTIRITSVETNHVNVQGIRSNIYHYAGYIYDYATSQYFVNARYYLSEVGRFAAEDRLKIDGLNRYVYVRSNPLRFVDPSGYCSAEGQELVGYGPEELGFEAVLSPIDDRNSRLEIYGPSGLLITTFDVRNNEEIKFDIRIDVLKKWNSETWSEDIDIIIDSADELSGNIAAALYTVGMADVTPNQIDVAAAVAGIIHAGIKSNIPAKVGDFRIQVNMVASFGVNETTQRADYEWINYIRYDEFEGSYYSYERNDNGWFYPLWDSFARDQYYQTDYDSMEVLNYRWK
jgi:RHS repeat-associated protein